MNQGFVKEKKANWLSRLTSGINSLRDTVVERWGVFTNSTLPAPLRRILRVVENTISLFRKHDTSTLGSSLSYFMIFSIAPMLIIVISVTGTILGPDAATGALKQQIQNLLGSGTAQQLQDMVKAAYQPGKNWIATTLSIVLLITGAIGVFDQLRSSLNIIWDVKPGAKKPFLHYLLNRLFSFGMIACLAFLLLVSLVIHAGIAALSGYLDRLLPHFSKLLLTFVEIIISFGITSTLFAFIYKFMSDIKIKWKVVWWGALFTAVLFAIGKYLIGFYISKSNLASTYGTASSIIVVLVWVFYSSQIVFFGAEFTRALAIERGMDLKDVNQN
jgi:membrane protein